MYILTLHFKVKHIITVFMSQSVTGNRQMCGMNKRKKCVGGRGGGYKLCICPITFSLLEIMHQNIPNMFVTQVQGTLCNKERREDSSIHFYIKSCFNNIKEIIIIIMIYINCGFFFFLVSLWFLLQRPNRGAE